MTRDDEDLVWHLCTRAATLLEDALPVAFAPPEHFGQVLDALEALADRTDTAAKLVTAALALTER